MNEPQTSQNQWQRSSTRRLFAWLFSRRTLVGLAIGLISLAVLAGLFYAVENWRGKRAWESSQRDLEAKGEKLDWQALLPPPAPDEQNFAATPLIKPLFVHQPPPRRGSRPALSPELRRVGQMDITLGATKRKIPPRLGSVERQDFADLQAWQKFYRGNTNFPAPPKGQSAAADVLTALSRFDDELQELQQAAQRPHARAPIRYDETAPADISLPYLSQLRSVAGLLNLRATASLESGQAAAALADVKLIVRLAETLEQEPLLATYEIQLATLGLALQGIREGLERHAWSDAHLAELEKMLAPINLLRGYQRVIRVERLVTLARLEAWREGEWPQFVMRRPGDMPVVQQSDLFQFTPGGWFQQNMATAAKWFQDHALAAVEADARRVFPTAIETLNQAHATSTPGAYDRLARHVFPEVESLCLDAARLQADLAIARTACALERFRLANGQYPDKLEALTPQFIAQLPHDPITGESLKYRRSADGAYVVYSVGWNREDDGGKMALTPSNPPRPDNRHGDWAWNGPQPKATSAAL